MNTRKDNTNKSFKSICKLAMMACLFLLVFAISFGIIFDTDISLDGSANNSANIAEAGNTQTGDTNVITIPNSAAMGWNTMSNSGGTWSQSFSLNTVAYTTSNVTCYFESDSGNNPVVNGYTGSYRITESDSHGLYSPDIYGASNYAIPSFIKTAVTNGATVTLNLTASLTRRSGQGRIGGTVFNGDSVRDATYIKDNYNNGNNMSINGKESMSLNVNSQIAANSNYITIATWGDCGNLRTLGVTISNMTLTFTITAPYSFTLANGGNGSLSHTGLQVLSTSSSSLTVTATPNEGYYFAGWSTDGTANGIIAGSGSTGGTSVVQYVFTCSNIIPFSTYTAIFEKGYTIKFDANGGNGSIADVAGIPGSSVSIPTVVGVLSNTGKYFTGWNTEANGSGTTYTNASTITGASGQVIMLYAQWADISYSFTFLAGSSGLTINVTNPLSGNTSNLPLSLTLPSLHQTRTFFGWRFANNTSSPIVMTNQLTAAMLTGFQTNILTPNITRTCYAAAIDSDFGRNTSSTAAWGSQANPYLIITATHLSNLGRIVNGTQTAQDSIRNSTYSTFATATDTTVQSSSRTYSGCYFAVQPSSGTSIAVNSLFVPIGTDAYRFEGTFDGNNNTLQNVNASGQYSGLFGYINGATISNLTLTNVNISGDNTSHGGLVGAAAGKSVITNCTVSSGTVMGSHQIGGIVGFASGKVTIDNCTNNATVYTTGTNNSDNNRTSAGGIVGYIGTGGNVTITNATNSGAVYCTNNSGAGVGGIIGYSTGTFAINSTTNNGTTNSGAIGSSSYTSVGRVGGIVGAIMSNSGRIYGTVTNRGNITGGSMVGGIVGYSDPVGILYGTFTNTGSVSGSTRVGGIGGQIHGYFNSGNVWGTFTNSGTVQGSGKDVGGCVGFADKELRNATNNAPKVVGLTIVGGVVGRTQANVRGCKNTGNVYATGNSSESYAGNSGNGTHLGGVVGIQENENDVVSNCYNSGLITKVSSTTNDSYVQSYANRMGGVVGRAGGYVQYCYNVGTVQGADYIGGVIGSARYSNRDTYCYNAGRVNCTWNDGGAHQGVIIGDRNGNSNTWELRTNTTGTLETTYGTKYYAGYHLTTTGTVTGIYRSGSGYASSSWENITLYDYIGFQTAFSISNGYYLRSTSTDNDADVTPTAGCVNDSKQTTASTSYTTPMNVGARFLATTGYNLTVASAIFKVSTTNRIYSGSNQASNLVTGVSPAFGSVYGVSHTFYTSSMGGTYVDQPTNAATYYIKTDITIGDVVVGRRTNTTATINKSTITLTHTWTSNNTTALSNSFIYNAAGQGISNITASATGGAPTNVINYTGSRTGVNVNRYSYTATIADTINYQLSGGGVARTYTYEITKCTLTVTHTWTSNNTTALSNTFIFNAAEQGIASYSLASNTAAPTTVYSTSTNQRGINVESYQFTISLTDTFNYQLKSDTTIYGDSITYTYTINKYDITNGIGNSTELSYLEENGYGDEFVWFKSGDDGKDGSSKNEDRLVVILAHKFGSASTFTTYEDYITAVRDAFNSYFRLAFLANDDSSRKIIAGTNADAMGNVSVSYDMNNKSGGIDGGEVDFIITVTGDNFTGTLTVKGYLIYSDFGGDYNAANWGGADNPYLIENAIHLFRLSQIVNGTTPAWNSINSNTTSIALYENTNAVAQLPTYAGAYFKLANDVDISDYTAFAPIGIYESSVNNAPFSATYFGGNNSTITLGIQSNAKCVGLFGYVKNTVIENLTVAGDVSAITKNSFMSYVGGIVGYAENTSVLSNISNAKINSATLDANKYDNSHYIGGDFVGGIVGHAKGFSSVLHDNTNNGAVSGGTFTGGETYIGSPYIGGIVGYAEDCMVSSNTNTAAITGANINNSCTGGIVGSAGGAIVTDNTNSGNVEGLSHVGGIVGRILAFSSVMGDKIGYVINGINSGNITAHGSYAGGIVGYAVESEIQSDKVDGFINSGTILADGNFAGGIVGLTYSGRFVATVEGSVNNSGNVTAVNYVGGVAGAMGLSVAGGSNQNSPTQRRIVKPTVSGTITGVGYLGGLFGYVYGSGYGDTPISNDASSGGEDVAETAADSEEEGSYIRLDSTRLNTSIVVTAATGDQIAAYIGGLAGYLEKTVIILTNSLAFAGTINARAANYVGGYVGYLGSNAGMISDSTPTDGAQISVTNNKPITNGGNYVGGIYGAVAAGAGVYNSAVREYSLAHNISLINSASVSGANYVGGLVGMFGQATSNAVSYTTRYSPDYNARNHSSVRASGNYAGGLFGYVGFGAVLTLENDVIDNSASGSTLVSARFYNGATADTNITITAAGYAGGIVGYLENSTHSFVRVYNKGRISVSTSGSYAGGLFGYMGGGAVSECFSSPAGTISVYTNAYTAASYVGGIAGYMNAGTVTNCYTQGFLYTQLSIANGGVVGFKHATNANVTDSWAIMLASKPTYESISANEYGKFIVLDNSVGVLMSVSELAVVTGLFSETLSTDTQASRSSLVAEYGKLSIAANVPSTNSQLVFYDGSGYDTSTEDYTYDMRNKDVDESNEVVRVRLANTEHSMIVAVWQVDFRNVPQKVGTADNSPQNKTNFIHSFIYPSLSDKYVVEADELTLKYDATGYISDASGTIYFIYKVTEAGATNRVKVGSFSLTFTAGSDATPFLISSQADWDAFAYNIYSGTNQYRGQTVRLMVDVSVGSGYSNFSGNGGYNLAGDLSDGEDPTLSTNHNFMGTFDGNGHTITINYNGTSPRVSVFANAAGAAFKNLTIAGNITSTSYDIAAFVAKPFGNLTFTNCTSNVNIRALRLGAGFAGYTRGFTITCIACINNGNITTTEGYTTAYGNYTYGTGGIIANVENTTTLESCKNTGNIVGGAANVGGIVGRSNAPITFYNCANTGNVSTTQTTRFNIFACVGGIIGKISNTGYLRAYACYNTGTITAQANFAGGIVGCIGDYYPAQYTAWVNNNYDYVETAGRSTISYCYNTGNVNTGGTSAVGYGSIWGGAGRINLNGTQAGGIAGTIGSGTISYSYNTGKVASYGCSAYAGSYQTRVGGIVGESVPQGDSSNNVVNINYCYNVGLVENAEGGTGSRYGATIVGYMDDATNRDNTHVSNTYALKNTVKYNNTYYESWNTTSGDAQWVKTGTMLDSIADFTAVYSANNGVGDNADRVAPVSSLGSGFGYSSSAKTLVSENGADINYMYDSSFINGTAQGWVYVYGCLPQLAVFALDTQNGLSMLSISYGKDQYGEFQRQHAGDSLSPYIIKDGIDLMGLSALVSSQRTNYFFNLEGEYIEFADGTNNVDGVKTAYINMDTYMYATALNRTANQRGKSYHLYSLGALNSNGPNPNASGAKTTWLSRNYRYNESSARWVNNVDITTINFYPIGVYGRYRFFGGNISGLQTDGSNTEIRNLKVDYTDSGSAYAGLFGRVQDATISNITVCGSVVGRTTTAGGDALVGGIAAYTGGTTVIDGCQAGTTANALKVEARSTQIGAICNAGGIVGSASTVWFDNTTVGGAITNMSVWQRYSFIAGATLTLRNCVSYATVTGFKDNIGGIVGYATASETIDGHVISGGHGTTVRVDGCKVLGGTLSAYNNSSATYPTCGTNIGGIGGGRDDTVIYALTNCEVGSNTALAPTTANVTIRGENALGGILAKANGDTNVFGCSVYGDVLIERRTFTNSGTCRDNSTYGTAIGGILGYSDGPCTIGSNGTYVNVGFYGTIKADFGSQGSTNIGGIVGFLGEGASIASGNITVKGRITASNANTQNVGGVIGMSANSAYGGVYDVEPIIAATNADNIGGFIGKNIGTCVILAADVTINIKGTIRGKNNIGGFIGFNSKDSQFGNLTASLEIAPPSYNNQPYDGSLNIGVECSVDGAGNIGGIVGNNSARISFYKGTITNKGNIGNDSSGATHIGGVIGANFDSLNISSTTALGNTGQVGNTDYNPTAESSRQSYVGGIIGYSEGTFEAASAMSNSGAVYGYHYVGGSIGALIRGTIAGNYSNSGTVIGVTYVGGVIGMVAKDGVLASNTPTGTQFSNTGIVVGANRITNQSLDVAEDALTEANQYIGGSIGAMFGQIYSSPGINAPVLFQNQGRVYAYQYSGGNVGVVAGSVSNAQFINSGALTFAGGDGLGGSIGYIGGDLIAQEHSPVSFTKSHSEYYSAGGATSLDVTGTSSAGGGGVGGVIGTIDSAFSSSTWADNTFYVNGNVTATGANNVGGVVGWIKKGTISIANMLAYDNTITGNNNVGGIVGSADAGVNLTLSYCYNVTISPDNNAVEGTSNVGGIIGNAAGEVDASTSYWVKGFSNEALTNSDINNLGTTLNATYKVFSTIINGETITFNAEFCNTHDVNAFARQYFGETSPQYTGWDDLMQTVFASDNPRLNASGDWIVIDSTGKAYTTGKANTGWYYVYATDGMTAAGASKNINTLHSSATTGDLTNLNYWKFIADAFSVADIANGLPDIIKTATSPIILNSAHTGGDGSIVAGFVYASAAAGTKDGMYLYMLASNIKGLASGGLTGADGNPLSASIFAGDSYYIRANSDVQNVLIFYKEIGLVSSIVYNGMKRYAPLLDTILNYETAETADKHNQYVYTLNGTREGYNFGTDTGSYYVDATIYFYDSLGNRNPVGSIVSSNGSSAYVWRITNRPLDITIVPTGNNTPYDGLTSKSHFFTATVDNIAGGDVTMRNMTFSFGGTNTIPVTLAAGLNTNTEASFSANGWYYTATVSYVGAMSDDDLKYNATDNLASTDSLDSGLYRLVVVAYYVNAGKYTMSTGNSPKNYSYTAVRSELEIARRTLTVRQNLTTAVYNGADHPLTLTFSNWATGETVALRTSIINGFRPSASSENGYNLNTSVSSTSYTVTDVINVDVYTVSFGSTTSGNYEVTLDRYSMTVTINSITVSWDSASNKIYDGQATTLTARFTAKSSFINADALRTAVEGFTWTASNTTNRAITSATAGVVVVEMTAGPNVGRYSPSVRDPNSTTNTNYSLSGALVRSAYEIRQKALTLSFTQSGSSPYIYSTYHQGLTKIDISGFVPGETISRTGVRGSGNGFKVSLSPSGSATVSGNFGYAVTNCIDVGDYSAVVSLNNSSNYYIDGEYTAKWTINKKTITISGLVNNSGSSSVVYDAKLHTFSVGLAADGDISGSNDTSFAFGNDRLSFSVTYASGNTKGVINAGTYTVSVGASNFSAIRNGTSTDTSANYDLQGAQSVSFEITPLEIVNITWTNTGSGTSAATGRYVYTAAQQGATMATVTYSDGTVSTVSTTSITSATVRGLGEDLLTFSVDGAATDVGSHTSTAVYMSVSGTNSGINSITGNYTLPSTTENSASFSIYKSIVRVSTTFGVSKTYDATTDIAENMLSGISYSFVSTNGGASNASVGSVSARYADANVGSGKTVYYTVGISSSASGNYQFESNSISNTNGTITSRTVTISLYLRSNRAYMTYSGETLYGSATNSSGNVTCRSRIYRSGQGFTVSNLPEAETSGALVIQANFIEADKSRSTLDAYVNNIVYNNGIYSSVSSGYYKALVFSLSGDSSANYSFSVDEYHSAAVAAGSSLTVYDSRDNAVGHDNDANSGYLYISIDRKTITANYDNTQQSYATENNTYNTDWLDVAGFSSGIVSGDDSSVSISVINNWMYVDNNPANEKRTYTSYTVINGTAAAREGLGAEMTSTNGRHLNYVLRNQPSLIIGYFVSAGDYYEVSTFAGLMLATYYYQLNFIGFDKVPTETVWIGFCTAEQYEKNEGMPEGYDTWDAYFVARIASINSDPDYLYRAGESTALTIDDIVYEDERGWGVWADKYVDTSTIYKSFRQTANISGTLTAYDISLLAGQFGDNWGAGKGYLQNFIYTEQGSVVTAIGSIFADVTYINENGESVTVPFVGTYDGNGYVIDGFNILAYASGGAATTLNVGMFERIGSGLIPNDAVPSNGKVTGVNLRNVNITVSDYSGNANTINVGGIAGSSQQNTSIENSSVHLTATVNSTSGTVNIGGIIGEYGYYETGVSSVAAVNGVISLGSIYVTAPTVNAGGIIGLIASNSVGYVNNAVSMTEIFSTSQNNTIGGLIGSANGTLNTAADVLTNTDGKQNAYLTDSIVNMTTGEAVNYAVGNIPSSTGNNVSYSALYADSVSGYNAQGVYYRLSTDSADNRGRYDVLSDGKVMLNNDGDGNYTQSSMYESSRLADIIDIYILLYSKTATTTSATSGGDTVTIDVYAKSSSSWLVGTAKGTDTSQIAIANQQHVGLLRMLRFASFRLVTDVTMYTNHSDALYSGAFYGRVSNSATVEGVEVTYTINLRSSNGNNPAKMFEVELSAHSLPLKKDTV